MPILARIEREFGKTVPLAWLYQHGTIAEVARLLEKWPENRRLADIVNLYSSGSGNPLVVMPGMWSQLSLPRSVLEHLAGIRPLAALQANLDHGELELYEDYRLLAGKYVEILREHQPQGPYAFAGYSYGGLMAFEVARQLRQQGAEIDTLVIIDIGHDPPPSWRNPRELLPFMTRFLRNLPGWWSLERRRGSLMKRSLQRLRQSPRRAIGSSPAADSPAESAAGTIDRRQQALRRLKMSFHRYRPEYYDGDILLFRANTRPLFHSLSRDLGWSRVARTVTVHAIPGDHMTILRSPGREQISSLIHEALRAQAERVR
jgi:thioesterase domain-containing protein